MTQQPNEPLGQLFHAIATGDDATTLNLIEHSPTLASAAVTDGASRAASAPNFLEEIEHHVYTGDTALHIAAAAYRLNIATALVANGANVHARNRRGAQPLHYATDGSPVTPRWNPTAQSAIITFLAKLGADLNSANKDGVAPLHRAVRSRSTAAVSTLLALGADVRVKNDNGSTPLHLAVQNTGRGGTGTQVSKDQQAKIIQLLLEHGARLSDTDDKGKTVSECITAEWIAKLVREYR